MGFVLVQSRMRDLTHSCCSRCPESTVLSRSLGGPAFRGAGIRPCWCLHALIRRWQLPLIKMRIGRGWPRFRFSLFFFCILFLFFFFPEAQAKTQFLTPSSVSGAANQSRFTRHSFLPHPIKFNLPSLSIISWQWLDPFRQLSATPGNSRQHQATSRLLGFGNFSYRLRTFLRPG